MERVILLQERELSLFDSYQSDILGLENILRNKEKRLDKLNKEYNFCMSKLDKLEHVNP